MAALGLSEPPISFLNTLTAIVVAHVFYNLTLVLRIVGNAWAHLDPTLEMAARTLGADRWQTLRRVTLPLLMPAILAATALVFLFDFTSFGVVLLLGGPPDTPRWRWKSTGRRLASSTFPLPPPWP